MKYVERIFNAIFSEQMLLVVIFATIFSLGLAAIDFSKSVGERTAAATAYCYNLGMVMVKTDAGQRCVAPANLVLIK